MRSAVWLGESHMRTDTIIKLPLRARRKRLPTIAGQPRGTVFGIVWNAFALPPNGLCYVVQFVGRSRVAVLGVVLSTGCVYPVTAPVRELPESTAAALELSGSVRAEGGEVFARDASGSLERVARYRGTVAGGMQEVVDESTPGRSMPYREFLASMYLEHCVFSPRSAGAGRQMQATQASEQGVSNTPVTLFRDFGQAALSDAIATLLYRIEARERPLGIEQYARRVLSRIDLPRLRALTAQSGVTLARIESMGGFYLNFDRASVSADDFAFLLGVEAALNRLSHVLDRIGAGLEAIFSSPDEQVCSELDWDGLRSTVAQVDKLLSDGGRGHCAMSAPGTVSAQLGGEWDVRMHFTELCEHLNMLVRLEYLFDYDARSGEIAVQFRAPDIDAVPYEAYDAHLSAWRTLDDQARARVARELGCRMGMVLAAAAFSASPRVSGCRVDAMGTDGTDSMYRFERSEFLVRFVPLAHRLAYEPLEGAAAIEALRSAREVSGSFAPIADRLLRCDPALDDRPLPEGLKNLLCADTAQELNVMDPPNDAYRARLDEIRATTEGDPDAAESSLHSLVEEMEASCVEVELLAPHPVQSQFCENQLGRIILPLLIDDRTTRIHRVPDALFMARQDLCNMYVRFGAYERALVEARKLVDIAATSMQAHFTLISVLARLKRYDEVIDVAKHGLRVAFDRESIAYLLYRLAFAYWNQGDQLVALACYRLVPRGEQISPVAYEEESELMRRLGVEGRLGLVQATAIAQAADIPIHPMPELFNQVADAAVQLMDEGFLHIAARCVYCMWRMHGADELGVLSKSLLWVTG